MKRHVKIGAVNLTIYEETDTDGAGKTETYITGVYAESGSNLVDLIDLTLIPNE
jgi:hypothetical protein